MSYVYDCWNLLFTGWHSVLSFEDKQICIFNRVKLILKVGLVTAGFRLGRFYDPRFSATVLALPLVNRQKFAVKMNRRSQ